MGDLMKEKKSILWRLIKYAFFVVVGIAILVRMTEEHIFDQPWLWPLVGLGWIIYTLSKDIDKLNKRIASLEHQLWQNDNPRSHHID
jgi:hypothetical protein